ncbi:uncharacterized protein METZ01_LOCUS353505 [marine metagenome]|uniref:Uncharacterized protein n=1 Tax=marine metagenome TaxID=408172 RepID=A0A382RVG4_9ZZZZ
MAIEEACKAYIMTTIQDVDREVFLINHFGERFGQDAVKNVVYPLKKRVDTTISPSLSQECANQVAPGLVGIPRRDLAEALID